MIQYQRSGRTTLKKQCDLLAAPSVTMTFANMRCLLRLYSRAAASAASGMYFCDKTGLHQYRNRLITTFSISGFHPVLQVAALQAMAPVELEVVQCTMKITMMTFMDKCSLTLSGQY